MHVKCLPDARVSLLVGDDGTLRAFAQHLLENFMRFASAKPPPYRPLGCCLARKEISRTMRNDQESGLVGKCVVDIVAAGRVQLDKSRLSTFLKSNSPWPMRIEKKGVYSD